MKTKLRLEGRKVLLTGVSRIGHDIALALAQEGADIFTSYLSNQEKTMDLITQIKSLGRRAGCLKSDLRNVKATKDLVEACRKIIGPPDTIIHLASTFEKSTTQDDSYKKWQACLELHLGSAYRLIRESESDLKKSRHGRVILFTDASVYAHRPQRKGFVAYYSAKAGLQGLGEAMALELAPNILVNMIAPGPILPAVGASKKEQAKVLGKVPLKKWGQSSEIVKAVFFLLETKFISGKSIVVDGGYSLT